MATAGPISMNAPSGATLYAGQFASGLSGSVAFADITAVGAVSVAGSTTTGSVLLDDLAVTGTLAGYVPAIPDDNLLAGFNEGTATTGWSVTSGSGSFTQSGSSVRLTASGGAVTGQLSLTGATSNDFLVLLKLSATYVSGQHAKVRLLASGTAVLDIALGYNLATSAAALGTISAYSTPAAAGVAIATGINYETTPQELLVHVDRNYSCVNLFIRETGGKWDFRGSFAYAANFSALTEAQIITSAHSGQWLEYDWLGYARLNMISIGDSICAGHNFFDPDPNVYAGVDNYANSWQKAATVYASLRNNYIANKGIGGQTSTQIQSRMAAYVTAHSPRLVFLHASTNDQVNGVSAATRSVNIQNGINAINAISAKCVLLNAMYGTSTNAINPAHRNYMDSWWASDRLSLTGIYKTVNIMTSMDSGSNYMASALTESDGIHPKAAGYLAIGTQIAGAGV